MSLHYLPICLNLRHRETVVVGAGNVGTQKVLDFLACEARVRVISPVASACVRELAAAGRIEWRERTYAPGDLDGAFLVAAATDDPEANEAIFRAAEAAGQLVNVCDDPPRCNYIFASRIERGPLTVSLFTHGTAPAFSRRVRREMEAWLGDEYARMAELMAAWRPRVKALPGLTQPQRQRIFERLTYSELLLLFREGQDEAAHRRAEELVEAELAAIRAEG